MKKAVVEVKTNKEFKRCKKFELKTFKFKNSINFLGINVIGSAFVVFINCVAMASSVNQEINSTEAAIETLNQKTAALMQLSKVLKAKSSDLSLGRGMTQKDVSVSEKRLELAQNHLLAGDSQRALAIALNSLTEIDADSAKIRVEFKRVAFESHRKLGNRVESQDICVSVLGGPDSLALQNDELWFSSCLLSLTQVAISHELNEFVVEKNANLFAQTFSFFEMKRKKPADAILLALTFNALKQTERGIKILDLNDLPNSNKGVTKNRAQFVLSILSRKVADDKSYYENLFSIINNNKIEKSTRVMAAATLGSDCLRKGNSPCSRKWLSAISANMLKKIPAFKFEKARQLDMDGNLTGASHLLTSTYKKGAEGYYRLGLRIANLSAMQPSERNKATLLAAKIKGELDADIQFLETLPKSQRNSSPKTELWRAQVLLDFNKQIKSPIKNSLDLEQYRRALQVAMRNDESQKKALLLALTPVDIVSTGNLDAIELDNLHALATYQSQMAVPLQKLDVLSLMTWREWNVSQPVAKNRVELLGRLSTIGDQIFKWVFRSADFSREKHRTENLNQTRQVIEFQNHNFALLSALKFESQIKAPHLALKMKENENLIADTLMSQRISSLTGRFPQSDLEKLQSEFIIFSKTARKLYELHTQMQGQSEPAQLQWEALHKVWNRYFETQLIILEASTATRNLLLDRRQNLYKDAEKIVRKMAEKRNLSANLKSDLVQKIGIESRKIRKDLLVSYNELKSQADLIMGDAALGQAQDAADLRKTLEQAAQERRAWHNSVRESIEMGLAR